MKWCILNTKCGLKCPTGEVDILRCTTTGPGPPLRRRGDWVSSPLISWHQQVSGEFRSLKNKLGSISDDGVDKTCSRRSGLWASSVLVDCLPSRDSTVTHYPPISFFPLFPVRRYQHPCPSTYLHPPKGSPFCRSTCPDHPCYNVSRCLRTYDPRGCLCCPLNG
jgi:hypothetical protein